MVPVWVEGDLGSVSSLDTRLGEPCGCCGVMTYRPMDQVKIDIVDTEVLQSGIEALLNALVEGARELTRDLPKKKRTNPKTRGRFYESVTRVRSLCDLSHPLTKISDRGTPD